jgi:hypothetical protein
MSFNWKPWVWLVGFIVLLMAGWGVYKVIISRHAVADAQLEKDYHDQQDSTKAWKDSYQVVEIARKNLRDTLDILSGLLDNAHTETERWHDSASKAKALLITITRPSETDSTNPKWMHRSIELEAIVGSQDKELASKDAEISLVNTQRKLLLSQLSKDSVALYSANGNIERLNSLVEGYKAKATCKVAWLLPCLSRTQSFIAGGLASGIGMVLVNRGRKK